jgi:glycosyltransferase involved in cell wall biosynthesis
VKSATENGKRLAVVLSHPTQYYSPWFRWIQLHTGLRFKVFYLWDFGVTQKRDPHFGTTFEWDVDLLSGYESEFVPNLSRNPGAESFFGFKNPALTKRLGSWGPDVILLFGYKWESHIRVILWAMCHGIPLIFRGDSHLLGRQKPALHVRVALRLIYSRFASFLYVGEANKRYFEEFGVRRSKLFFAPHSVNTELFDPASPAYRTASEKLRSDLGLTAETRVVLFAGKLVSAKQPGELLQAFAAINLPCTALIFVGEGPEKGKLQSMVARFSTTPSGPRVAFLPFSNQSEMPARYLAADIFILPSRGVYETWGLAVNEAMHMGLPCIVSERVGCQTDLVTPGETGWVFNSDDPAALEKVLYSALEEIGSPSRKNAIRDLVERRIAGYTYVQTTEGLIAALGALPPNQPPKQ